jgi:hypothetical protein
MNVTKSVLLGSVVGVAGIVGAQAADLPTRKSAPIEYVRICNVDGMAGFWIPGSNTCLKFGGYLASHFSAGNIDKAYSWTPGTLRGTQLTSSPADLRSDLGELTRVMTSFDTRTDTDYGVLRGYLEIRIETGNDFDNFTGYAVPGSLRSSGNQLYMAVAYIQWMGITAGRVHSFFQFIGGGEAWDPFLSPDQESFNEPIVFAYTATFGNGFSATVAAQNPAPLGPAAPGDYVNIDTTNFGERAPDMMGILRVDENWGSAQLSGVAHEVHVYETAVAPTVPGTPIGAPSRDVWGFAVNGGGKLNLPSFGAGDFIQAQVTYSQNAMVYSGAAINGGCGSWTGNGLAMSCADAYYAGLSAGGNPVWSKPTTWTFGGTMEHHFSPNWALDPEFSYAAIHWDNSLGQLSNNSNTWIGGVAAFWYPVPMLWFEVDLLYQRTHQSTPANWNIAGAGLVDGVPGSFKANNDGFTGRLQVRRIW